MQGNKLSQITDILEEND